MKTIQRKSLPVAEWKDRYIELPRVLTGPTRVIGLDRRPVLYYLPKRLEWSPCWDAFDALETAGGGKSPHRRDKRSGTLGYFGEENGKPKLTHRTRSLSPSSWASIVRLAQHVDSVFQEDFHELYWKQRKRVRLDSRIKGTAFTTITANRSERWFLHPDGNNLSGSLSALTVMSEGDYRGGELIFPSYQVAVDLQPTDLLLADMSELHGNAPLVAEPRGFVRVSAVFYVRKEFERKECAAMEN